MDREMFKALTPRYQVQAVLRIMGEIVAEFGDAFVYGGACQYVCGIGDNASPYDDDGEVRPVAELAPDCIVGRVMARLGYDLAVMAQRNSDSIDAVTWTDGVHPETVAVLRIAQASQDGWEMLPDRGKARSPYGIVVRARREWSTALARAEGYASTLSFDE